MISPHSFSPTQPQTRHRQRDKLVPNPKANLVGQLHEVMRFFHYSAWTEASYWQWIVRYLRFHRGKPSPLSPLPSDGRGEPAAGEGQWRHPKEMGAAEVREFLTHLASEREVSASTQNQALNALVFSLVEG